MVTPASRAAWIVAMLSASSAGPYPPDMPMQPRPTSETGGPLRPRGRVRIVVLLVERDPSGQARGQAFSENRCPARIKAGPGLFESCSGRCTRLRCPDVQGRTSAPKEMVAPGARRETAGKLFRRLDRAPVMQRVPLMGHAQVAADSKKAAPGRLFAPQPAGAIIRPRGVPPARPPSRRHRHAART